MSKRRQSTWQAGLMNFSDESPRTHWPIEIYEENTEVLEDAQEALSKLYCKTNKRTKQIKGIRRNDAWH